MLEREKACRPRRSSGCTPTPSGTRRSTRAPHGAARGSSSTASARRRRAARRAGAAMKADGLLGHVLVSHDAGWYHVGEPGGGEFRPFDTLFTTFVPALKAAGSPTRRCAAPRRQPAAGAHRRSRSPEPRNRAICSARPSGRACILVYFLTAGVLNQRSTMSFTSTEAGIVTPPAARHVGQDGPPCFFAVPADAPRVVQVHSPLFKTLSLS